MPSEVGIRVGNVPVGGGAPVAVLWLDQRKVPPDLYDRLHEAMQDLETRINTSPLRIL